MYYFIDMENSGGFQQGHGKRNNILRVPHCTEYRGNTCHDSFHQIYEERHFKHGVAIIILLVVLLAHRILGIVFFSAKLVSKLPVIHSADKLLGAVVGVVETALIIWLVFAMTGKMGMVGSLIVENIADSRILQFLYSHSYLHAVLNQVQRVIS